MDYKAKVLFLESGTEMDCKVENGAFEGLFNLAYRLRSVKDVRENKDFKELLIRLAIAHNDGAMIATPSLPDFPCLNKGNETL